MTFETLLVEQHGTVLVVTLNRPRALNALNGQLLAELSAVVAGAATDAGVRALVLTGAGDRAFAAGADINELASLDAESGRRFAASGQAVFSALERLGKPSIAAINGFALGGGCELAMACTLRLAADTAQFGQPEVDLGIIPGFGGSQRLARLVGRGRALALLLGGHNIGAEEAERIGLVNRVVAVADLKTEALALAQQLAEKAPLAVRYLLNAVYAGADLPLDQALQLEATLFGLSASTADMKEGTRAFLEKRIPKFTGR
jgi:enoyl-CoA hydratase